MQAFKTSFRNIKQNKYTTLINLLSLVVGFVCVILIGFWIKSELSYDNFHPYSQRTYRISYTGSLFGKEIKDATTSKAFNEALLAEFPEVDNATLLFNFHTAPVKLEDNNTFRLRMSGVNPDFFSVFNVPVLSGNIEELAKPNTAFITQSTARKLFGNSDPIGKIISTGMDREEKQFTISGVAEDYPENSHIEFDILYSNVSQSWYNVNFKNWFNASFHNYVVLKEGTNVAEFEHKFNEYVKKQMEFILTHAGDLSIDGFYSDGNWTNFEFHPIQKIHLIPTYDSEYKASGNILYIYIFAIAGGLILLITIINFSNLSTIGSLKRSKEIGIKKASGSSRGELVFQFLFECVLLSFIALVLAFVIIFILTPYYEQLSGINILDRSLFSVKIAVGSVVLALLAGVLSGTYPAFYLSSLVPAKVLSGASQRGNKGLVFKDILIVFQFTISIVVITGTLFISGQLRFLQNENLGFNKENIVVLKGTENLSHETSKTLNEQLQKRPNVIVSSSSNYIPNSDIGYYVMYHETDNNSDGIIIDILPCDNNFKDVYNLEIAEGSFWDDTFSPDSRKIVINETAAKMLNCENCIGNLMLRDGHEYRISGVVKDFHYNSKEKEVPPMALVQMPDVSEFWPPLFCSVLIGGNDVSNTLASIEQVWENVAGKSEFRYVFFDEEYDKLYKQEAETSKVFAIFSIVAIALSCFGLFAFVRFMVQTRTKEIGIRKVNGAKAYTIFGLLMVNFIRPVSIAVVISIPITYFLVENWLSNFAYRISVSPLYFALGILIILVSIFVTVARQSFVASKRNPVEALRYE